ncbi:MAG: hypothetical protein RJA70_1659 [Pseudomonadota bacterium]|jgi:hypothetical protein
MKTPSLGSGLLPNSGSFAAPPARSRGPFRAPQRRLFIGGALLVVGLLACDDVGRKEPSPAGMCRELRDTCRGLGGDKDQLCFSIGVEGVKDPAQEDQCFAVYPSCIAVCAFLRQERPEAPDAASQARVSGDAALVDASSADEHPAEPPRPDSGVPLRPGAGPSGPDASGL